MMEPLPFLEIPVANYLRNSMDFEDSPTEIYDFSEWCEELGCSAINPGYCANAHEDDLSSESSTEAPSPPTEPEVAVKNASTASQRRRRRRRACCRRGVP